jgi:hypothetical protein
MASFEERLKSFLRNELAVEDLDTKHAKMKSSAFVFLRGTCWRWAETAAELLPYLAGAPKVLSPGDAHIENFGLWRDAEGRLVWGVNDFDEAASIPYPFDLVRLGTSALLAAAATGFRPRAIARALLKGYCAGLANPHPIILEDSQLWLRDLFAATRAERSEFWDDLQALKEKKPPRRYVLALQAALPKTDREDVTLLRRRAGVGSLGRPRFVALGRWRGGPIAREAKALVPSCWLNTASVDRSGHALLRAARGRYRSPDPWLDAHNGVIVRRLAPNSRKLEIDKIGRLRTPVLAMMGFELANIHAGDANAARRIAADLDRRKPKWLATAIEDVAVATIRDWKAFKRSE